MRGSHGRRTTLGLGAVAVLAVAGLLTGPVLLPADDTAHAATTAEGTSPPEADVVRLTNDERAGAGCPAVTSDPRIAEAAQRHSDDMAARGYFAHDSQDGRSFDQRISDAGYPTPGAENIAMGQDDAREVVRDWMESPGHRRNILDCSLSTIGVGLSGDGQYWTQDFGR